MGGGGCCSSFIMSWAETRCPTWSPPRLGSSDLCIFVTLASKCDRKERSERRYLAEDNLLQKTCQNMPSPAEPASGPDCLCCTACGFRQQMKGKFIHREHLKPDRRWMEAGYDGNEGILSVIDHLIFYVLNCWEVKDSELVHSCFLADKLNIYSSHKTNQIKRRNKTKRLLTIFRYLSISIFSFEPPLRYIFGDFYASRFNTSTTEWRTYICLHLVVNYLFVCYQDNSKS